MTRSKSVRGKKKIKGSSTSNLENASARLKSEYKELEANHAELQDQYKAWENDHKALLELNERLARVNAESAELMVELEEKNDELRMLNERLAEANASTVELVAELEDRNETLLSTNEQLARANAHAAELMAIIELKNEEIEKLNQSLSQANARGADLVAERELNLDEMRKLNKKLSNEIKVRKKVEDRLNVAMKDLKHKNHELDEFNHTISHDLKNPLTTIHGFAEMMEIYYKDKLDEEGMGYIKKIESGCQRMVRLIDDLLELSSAGKDNDKISMVDLNSVLHDVINSLDSKIAQQNLNVEYPRTMPEITYNPIRINQVFSNLIENSIKFIDDNNEPYLKIGYEEKPNKYIFEVTDNGKGIKEDDLEKIFIPFRHNDSNSEGGSGINIGLSVVKKIVESHGGRIWVNSAEGKGATFKFTVPKVAENN